MRGVKRLLEIPPLPNQCTHLVPLHLLLPMRRQGAHLQPDAGKEPDHGNSLALDLELEMLGTDVENLSIVNELAAYSC